MNLFYYEVVDNYPEIIWLGEIMQIRIVLGEVIGTFPYNGNITETDKLVMSYLGIDKLPVTVACHFDS